MVGIGGNLFRRWILWGAAGLALVLAGCDDAQVTSAEYLERARTLLEDGDAPGAAIEARNAVQADPDSAEARRFLGELLLAGGLAADAEAQLSRARALGMDDRALLVELGRAWLLQGDFATVLSEIAEPVPAETETDAQLLIVRANALFGSGEVAAARSTFQRSVDVAPLAEAYAGLARLALAEDDLTRAEDYVERGRDLSPDSPVFVIVQAELALRRGEAGLAAERFGRALQERPTDLAATLGLARAQIADEDFDSAAATLDGALESAPENVLGNYLRAAVAYQLQDFDETLLRAERVLQITPQNVPTLTLAAASALALERTETAHRYAARAAALAPEVPDVRRLLATVQVRLGLFDEALQTLGPDLGQQADDFDALALAGDAALQAGDPAQGARLLEQALAANPEDTAVLSRLGMARLAAGAAEEAIEDLRRAVAAEPDSLQARTLLALALIAAERTDEALDETASIQSAFPDTATGPLLEGIARLTVGDQAAAETAMLRALEIEPGHPDAADNLARMALGDEDLARARDLWQGVLEHQPDHLRTLIRMAWLERQDGNPQRAAERYEQAIAAAGTSVLPRVMYARWRLEEGETARALEILQPEQSGGSTNPLYLQTLGVAYIANGQPDLAVGPFETLARTRADSAEAQVLFGDALRAAGRDEDADSAYQQAVALDGTSVPARMGYARLLLARNDLEAAEHQLVRLAELAPDDPQVRELQAVALVDRDQPEEAAAFLRRSMDEVRTTPGMVRMLARLDRHAGDQDAAEALLEGWLADNPDDLASRMLLADMLVAGGAYANARDHYSVVVEGAPENVAALNNLAYASYQLGDFETARLHAEAAIAEAPDNPLVMDTLAGVLLETGETERALALLEAASAAMPENPAIVAHYARALAASGQEAQARDLLAEVLATEASFDGREEAEALAAELEGR